MDEEQVEAVEEAGGEVFESTEVLKSEDLELVRKWSDSIHPVMLLLDVARSILVPSRPIAKESVSRLLHTKLISLSPVNSPAPTDTS